VSVLISSKLLTSGMKVYWILIDRRLSRHGGVRRGFQAFQVLRIIGTGYNDGRWVTGEMKLATCVEARRGRGM
jgi:hypothetical protein